MREQLPGDPTPEYTLCTFANSQQWETFCEFYNVRSEIDVSWYDIRRIDPTA